MKVGYTIWYPDLRNMSKLYGWLSYIGLDYIELSLDYPLYIRFRERLRKLKTLATDLGINIAIHAPWRDIKLATPIEDLRKASVKHLTKSLSRLDFLEPTYILIHLATEQSLFDGVSDKCVEASIKSLNELIKVTDELGTDLVIETTHHNCCTRIHHLNQIISEVPEVGLCVDIPHLLSNRLKDLKPPINDQAVHEELNNILKGLSVKALSKVIVLHVHGFKFVSPRTVIPHLTLTEDMLRHVKQIIKRLRGSLRYVLLETYRTLNGKRVNRRVLKDQIGKVKELVKETEQCSF